MSVRDLKVYYRANGGWVRAVDGISLDLDRGESLGIVGESGCGKSTFALALMRLLPPAGRVVGGEIIFDGINLLRSGEEELRKIRGKRISMIFQGAMNSLNPVKRVGDQVKEAIEAHESIPDKELTKRVGRLFELVMLSPSRMKSFPHELSGGMKQRVCMAIALACNPELVIMDEPTTALDVVVQDQILSEVKTLQKKFNFSVCYISHDISVIFEVCDKIAVMYGGKIVEYADAETIYKSPSHPYTIGLLQSFPSIRGQVRKLVSIPGNPPDLLNPSTGCRFQPRCPIARDICLKDDPPLVSFSRNHFSLCHFASDPKMLRGVRFEE